MAALPLIALLSVAAAVTPPPDLPSSGVYALSEAEFVKQAQSDLEALQRYANGLRRVQDGIKANKAVFNQKETVPYTPDQKRILLSAWASLFDYVLSCEVIRQRYWDFVKIVPHDSASKKKHVWGYLLTHGALTTELAHGMTYSDLTAGRKQLETLLDEPSPEFGLPPKAYAQFKYKVIHVNTSTQLMTGDAYLSQLKPLMKETGALDDKRVQWVLQEMKLNSKVARGKLLKRGVNMFVKNAVDIAKDTAASAIFPVQKGVAEWMGDTRVNRIGQPLISREQALEVAAKMEPGDVMVARQNWFISNIGLPGFWPHAELFLATQDEFTNYFDADPEVEEWVKTLPGKPATFSAYLSKKFPEKWAAFAGKDEHGDPIRIMEAISEGVSFTGIEHGMRVDYLGVLRPRLTKLDKAKAMVRAFGYQGRPYDFDFDFFSDSSLVCSELVFKSYQPSKNQAGIRIDLVGMAGRMTLPPNEYVRLFDEEHDKPGHQFDFVAFLDGREDLKGAFLNTEDAFRQSYRRMKWDIAQK